MDDEAVVGEAFRLAAGTIGDLAPLDSEYRQLLRAMLTRLLLSRPARDSYIQQWRRQQRQHPLPPDVEGEWEAMELPADALADHGVDALTDVQLVGIVIQPHAMIVLAEMLDEAIVTNTLGDVWREPFERAVRDAYPEPIEESLERLRIRLEATQSSGGSG